MPSILDQLDKYYAMKRDALNGADVSVPKTLRHPNAGEFFDNLMKRQKTIIANANKTTQHGHSESKNYQSSLISA